MIQRIIYNLLTSGVEAMTANPKILDDIFSRQYGLSSTEVEAIKTYFASTPPSVVNGYANRTSDFPVMSVVLGSEREVEHVIGESGGHVNTEGDALWGADVEVSIWEHTVNIYIYSENHDVTEYYYEIAKTILQAGTGELIDDGQYEIHLSGTELAPDPAYIPEHLFARQLTIQSHRELTRVDRDSLSTKAYQVSGIHVDSSGSPSDVGGVDTLVTTYTEDENG